MKNEEIMTAIDTQAEELNPLQIFLLAMVKAGLKSPYDLLMKAGLGAGLTSPALKRLEAAGLLHGTPGPRNRTRYAITRDGVEVLRRSLERGSEVLVLREGRHIRIIAASCCACLASWWRRRGITWSRPGRQQTGTGEPKQRTGGRDGT